MKAYSYIRWSSVQQTDGDSLRRQTEAAAAYAAKHDLTLDNTSYRDAGISAFKGKNLVEGKLGAFLKAVDSGKIDTPCYLLVEALDRITRDDIISAAQLFLSIIERNVTIVTLLTDKAFSKESIKNSWTDLIIALSSFVQGHEDSAKRGVRVRKAWDVKRVKIKESNVIASRACPAWLTVEKGKFIVDREKAAAVKRIFKLAIDGNGILAISKILNIEGVPRIGKRRVRNEAGVLVDREENLWTTGMVGNLFRQEAVFGRWREDRDHTNFKDKYYPVIISKKDFDLVTVGRDKRKGGGGGFKQGTSNLFSGLTRCAYCGGPLKYKSNSRKNDYFKSVLVCRKSEAKACKGPWTQHMPYASMEIEIIINLMIYTRRVIELQTMDQTNESQRNTYDQLILEKQTILERLGEIAANSKVDIVVIADRLEKEQMEMDKLMDERAKLNGSQVTEEEMNDHLKILDELYRKPDMITTDDSNRALRLQIQTSLRRQIRKIEVAPGIEDHPKYYKHFDLKKRPKRTPCHMVKISYLDGTDEAYEIHHGMWDTDESGAPI